jgi:hypothetical protein
MAYMTEKVRKVLDMSLDKNQGWLKSSIIIPYQKFSKGAFIKDTNATHELNKVKKLDSGSENNGLCFSVPAAKLGDAVSIARWIRYRFSSEYVGHVILSISSVSLYLCGIPACIIWGVSEMQNFAFLILLVWNGTERSANRGYAISQTLWLYR